jgi:hypothetical protein
VAQWREFQRFMAKALYRPLTAQSRMQKHWPDGRRTQGVAASFVKPNGRLSSFERLEIYNRQYWFRVLDCFYDDYPGLRAVLGERAFLKLAEAYLVKCPSASFTLRNLGSRLEKFLTTNPDFAGKKLPLALDVVRFEWAQIIAFDGPALPPFGMAEMIMAEPATLRLRLQPYISLLALQYPVDDYVISVKRHEALRGEASNAMDSAPKGYKLKKVSLPRQENVFVAVHRHNNALYYKRLEPEAFTLLTALSRGVNLETACARGFRGASPLVDWPKKLQEWFQDWSSLGWFCSAGSSPHINNVSTDKLRRPTTQIQLTRKPNL